MIEIKLCEYGCGKPAMFLLKFKHTEKWCCSNNKEKCKSNIKVWNKGLTKETNEIVKQISESKLKKQPWNYGLTKDTDIRVRKISTSNIGKNNSLLHNLKISSSLKGVPKSKEHIKKISESLKGNQSWNKGLTKDSNDSLMIVSKKLTGVQRSCETKEKLRKINLGKATSKETRIKIGKKLKGKRRTQEQIQKFVNSVRGTKHHKLNYYLIKYPNLFQIEVVTENLNTKNLLVNCKVCGKQFSPSNTSYNKISYRAEMINHGKFNKGVFLCSEKCKEDFLNQYKSEYEIYCRKVWKETYKSLKRYSKKIPNIELRSKKFHLDHKYSIHQGFQNNVNPIIIGHWKNLEIVESVKNLKKYNRCSITLENLIQETNSRI